MQNAASPLHETLLKSEQAALEVQLNPGEALIPPLCREQVKSDHQPGEEAEHVTVAVSDTCEASAYDAHTLYTNATQFLTTDALNRLGTGYIPVGDTQVTIIRIAITDHARGIATIVVKLDATYVYQISPGEKQQLLHLIAGKTKQQAVQALLRMPGIQGARISGNAATVPTDPGSITIVIMERL